MNEHTWPAEWIRATLSQSALAIVAAEETTYGYRILQRLEAAGFGKIKGGTLYPILARLEADGLVTSSWGEGVGGPGRKFISITDAGREELNRLTTQWQAFRVMIDDLWRSGPHDQPADRVSE
jgi:PadR family transcriptional regulator PadR